MLLAGGGEFALVVFKLATDLGLLEQRIDGVLTASVIISMSLTPLLGEVRGSADMPCPALPSASRGAHRGVGMCTARGWHAARSVHVGCSPALIWQVAQYVGEAVERIDASSEAAAKADQLFDVIDADGNGSIERGELREYLLGGGAGGDGSSNASFEALFDSLDLNGDGVISRSELRTGYTELIVGEVRDAALQCAATAAEAR